MPKDDGARSLRWLDVLPCTGIVTEKIYRNRPGFRFDVVERTIDVAEFVAARTRPRAGTFAWPAAAGRNGFGSPPEGGYDVVSCFFRLENLPAAERAAMLAAIRGLDEAGRQGAARLRESIRSTT